MNKLLVHSLVMVLMITYASCATSKRKKNEPQTNISTPQTVVVDTPQIPTSTSSVDKNPVVAPPIIDSVNIGQWIPQSNLQSIQYKATCNYNNGKSTQAFTANIKIQCNQKIWISVIGMGIVEVARALILPDSVYLLDRLHGKAYVKDYNYLSQMIGVDIDFSTFQNILMNELPNKMPGTYESSSDYVMINSPVNEKINSIIKITPNSRQWNSMILNFTAGKVQQVELFYNMFQQMENAYNQSTQRRVTIHTATGLQQLDMDLDKFKFNESLDLHFSIPERFTIEY